MITNIVTVLWFVFFAVLVYVVWRGKEKKNHFPFQNFGVVDVPYVTMDIQGKKFNMIVDTACGVSLFCVKPLVESGIHYEVSQRHASLQALTDETVETEAVNVEFMLNGLPVKETFFVYHEDVNFSDFEEKYGITIHGLIGVEFLDAHDCKVDFKTHKLIVK